MRLCLLNYFNLIQYQENWQDWYNDAFHLWAQDQAGYYWMAETSANIIPSVPTSYEVPEPGSLIILGIGSIILLSRRKFIFSLPRKN